MVRMKPVLIVAMMVGSLTALGGCAPEPGLTKPSVRILNFASGPGMLRARVEVSNPTAQTICVLAHEPEFETKSFLVALPFYRTSDKQFIRMSYIRKASHSAGDASGVTFEADQVKLFPGGSIAQDITLTWDKGEPFAIGQDPYGSLRHGLAYARNNLVQLRAEVAVDQCGPLPPPRLLWASAESPSFLIEDP